MSDSFPKTPGANAISQATSELLKPMSISYTISNHVNERDARSLNAMTHKKEDCQCFIQRIAPTMK